MWSWRRSPGASVGSTSRRRALRSWTPSKQTLTNKEWAFVDGDDKRFRALWACKEAFTKARGDGLGFPFADAEFTLTHHGDASFEATVAVDGVTLTDWRFRGVTLNGHVCVVGAGPCLRLWTAGAFRRTMASELPAGASTRPGPPSHIYRRATSFPPRARLAGALCAPLSLSSCSPCSPVV